MTYINVFPTGYLHSGDARRKDAGCCSDNEINPGASCRPSLSGDRRWAVARPAVADVECPKGERTNGQGCRRTVYRTAASSFGKERPLFRRPEGFKVGLDVLEIAVGGYRAT